MKVYYAHDESTYNSKEEDQDRGILGQFGFNVLDPNSPDIQERIAMLADSGNVEAVKNFMTGLVDSCSSVVFRSKNGTLTPSIKAVVKRAIDTGKPVLELPILKGRV